VGHVPISALRKTDRPKFKVFSKKKRLKKQDILQKSGTVPLKSAKMDNPKVM